MSNLALKQAGQKSLGFTGDLAVLKIKLHYLDVRGKYRGFTPSQWGYRERLIRDIELAENLLSS